MKSPDMYRIRLQTKVLSPPLIVAWHWISSVRRHTLCGHEVTIRSHAWESRKPQWKDRSYVPGAPAELTKWKLSVASLGHLPRVQWPMGTPCSVPGQRGLLSPELCDGHVTLTESQEENKGRSGLWAGNRRTDAGTAGAGWTEWNIPPLPMLSLSRTDTQQLSLSDSEWTWWQSKFCILKHFRLYIAFSAQLPDIIMRRLLQL